MNKDIFINELKKLGIEVSDEKIKLLDEYAKFLIEYNEHTNLTAIKDINDIYLKHFYDSLTITKVINLKKVKNLLDIGTGAGFPGVVLKIFYPNLSVTLVDSNGKKTTFLNELVQRLKLDNVIIINNRVENLYKEYINSFDVVTSRAVANMSVLSELSIPFVKKFGYFIAMKGKNNEEIDESISIISKMNSSIVELKEFKLYNDDNDRTLIKIIKNEDSIFNNLRTYEQIIKSKNKLQKGSK